MPSNIFVVIVALIALAFSALTILLGLFAKSKVLKYLPSIISGLAALGFFIKANFFAQGFEDIGYMIFALIAAVIFLVSILTAMIVGFVNNRR